jgi:predicted DNA-binding protein (MmcQ/YjbR family)
MYSRVTGKVLFKERCSCETPGLLPICRAAFTGPRLTSLGSESAFWPCTCGGLCVRLVTDARFSTPGSSMRVLRPRATASVFERPVFARVRRLCLAFPETAETESWGHPNFRAGTKTFCTCEIVNGRPSIAFRLAPPDVERVSRRRCFFATPYGRGLWISRWVDHAVDWREIATLVEHSYRRVANKRNALGALQTVSAAARPRRSSRGPRKNRS